MPMPVSMPAPDPAAVPVVAETASAPVAVGLRVQAEPVGPRQVPESSAGGFVNQDGAAVVAGARASRPASPGAVTQAATASRSAAGGSGEDPVGRSTTPGEAADGHAEELSRAAIPGLNGAAGLPGHVADTPAPAAPAPGHAAAVAAAVAQLAQESAQTAPGTVRNLELRLRTGELGLVRVKLAVDRAGGVRIEVRTASDQAAQALRSGLPQLADALAARQLALSGAAVQVMSGAEFGGSNQPRQQPRWFERARKPGLSSGDAGEPVLAGIGATSWGRGPAGVNVLA